MTYIWEALLAAQKAGKNVLFEPAEEFSPYLEVTFDDLNPALFFDKPVKVNAWYRFASICDALLGENTENPEIQNGIFDSVMYLLGWGDLHSGLCRSEYYGLFLHKDIQNKLFGNQTYEAFTLFTQAQRRFILENLVRLYRLGPCIELLRTTMCHLYPGSLLYLDTNGCRDLLIYIGKKETQILKAQIDFILSLFLPLDYEVRLFWDLHFGIIGVNETMEIDEIYIY